VKYTWNNSYLLHIMYSECFVPECSSKLGKVCQVMSFTGCLVKILQNIHFATQFHPFNLH